MIEGTPKTKAPTMVAAVVMPIRRLRACRAYTRLVTLTRAGAGSAGTSMFSDIRVAASAHHGDSGSLHASMKSTVSRLLLVCQLIADFLDSGLNPRGKALKGWLTASLRARPRRRRLDRPEAPSLDSNPIPRCRRAGRRQAMIDVRPFRRAQGCRQAKPRVRRQKFLRRSGFRSRGALRRR